MLRTCTIGAAADVTTFAGNNWRKDRVEVADDNFSPLHTINHLVVLLRAALRCVLLSAHLIKPANVLEIRNFEAVLLKIEDLNRKSTILVLEGILSAFQRAIERPNPPSQSFNQFGAS